MPLIIELTLEEETRLAATARQRGIAPAEYARRLLTERLPPLPSGEFEDPTLALFAQWEREDASMTPQDMEEERQAFEAFKQGINAERERAGARRIFE
ncbi:MAG: hypothetical protein IT210_02585 [Armatimonadetes bacterium]|nr:hypothetical protein [Armatimonadota bacterium]